MKKIALSLLMLLFSFVYLNAQELVKREVNGAKFYVHVVKTGETLFTIAQLYERQQQRELLLPQH